MSESSDHSAAPEPRSPEADLSSRVPLEERALDALDWSRIVQALVERTATLAGARRCDPLPVVDDIEEARAALDDLSEMLLRQAQDESLPLGGIEDIALLLGAVEKGEVLGGPDLLSVAHTLESLVRLRNALADSDDTPRLSHLARGIEPQADLAAWLVGSFDSRGELSVTAYPQLSSLRGKKAQLHESIGRTLDRVRGDDRYVDALQDDFLALRGDRYVLPVKVQHKGAGLGIVHDTSGSGQTVFIEPFEIVELNNDLKMADSDLRREEHRILDKLSADVARASASIGHSLDIAARLDCIHARALLAADLDATVPTLSDDAHIDLRMARHPVLVLRGIDVVPNDLALGGAGSRALILSGPNTGGKTITLKTLGLCALMVRGGLALPTAEGSTMGWFPSVLTDIGDPQDIEGDLSTFSGHVLCVVEILDALRRGSGHGLVLVDEIAAGTDPVQGAALGRAMLEALLDHDVLIATTTHYPEIKGLSGSDDRFTNARVEFDGEEGRPTYYLSVGRAGSSHAMDVAEGVGLPPSILQRARSLLAPAAAEVEGLLSGIEADAAVARRLRTQAEAEAEVAHQELQSLREERDEVRRRSRDLERELRAEFEDEVRGYRDTVRGALRQIRKTADEGVAERARQRITDGAAHVRERLAERGDIEPIDALDAEALAIGDRVRVVPLDKDATVEGLPDGRGRMMVDVGGLRMQVNVAELEAPRGPAPSTGSGRSGEGSGAGGGRKGKAKGQKKGSSSTSPSATESCTHAFRSDANTLDLRGNRVDEALPRLDRFLDDRLLRGDRFGFVLHGLGTGVLRDVVRKHLADSPYVDDLAPGTRSQGGDGITVVRIAGA